MTKKAESITLSLLKEMQVALFQVLQPQNAPNASFPVFMKCLLALKARAAPACSVKVKLLLELLIASFVNW